MSTGPTTPLAPAPSSPSSAASSQVVGEAWSARLRRWRPLLAALAVFVVVSVATALMRPSVSKVPYALDNPGPTGAQAVGALLREEGVSPRTVRSVNDVLQATAGSSDPSRRVTVALIHAGQLTAAERAVLARSGADVTVIGSTYEDLTGLTDLVPSGVSSATGTTLTPQCPDPDAQAAQSLDGVTGSLALSDGAGADSPAPEGVVACFPVGTEGDYAYVVAPLEGGGRLRVISDPSVVTNARLAQEGNAALSVRALGHHETLLWLDASQKVAVSVWNPGSLPAWFSVTGLQALLTLGVLALVRGRRFGRLVAEDLPVLVHATETTRGRARLYHLAGDRHRAARALRAAAARRLGHRLGVPASADPGTLVAAVASAAGRSERSVHQLLYGPVPDSHRSLTDLASQLDHLESEVSHR
nr:DUF4350 domain-containing protein [Actinomyces sp.]